MIQFLNCLKKGLADLIHCDHRRSLILSKKLKLVKKLKTNLAKGQLIEDTKKIFQI